MTRFRIPLLLLSTNTTRFHVHSSLTFFARLCTYQAAAPDALARPRLSPFGNHPSLFWAQELRLSSPTHDSRPSLPIGMLRDTGQTHHDIPQPKPT